MIFDEDPYDQRDMGHGDDWVETWAVMTIVACVIGMGAFFFWFYTKG